MPTSRVRIKKGWEGAGRAGTRLGLDVFVEQGWAPVLWDDEEDPTFFKSAGLAEKPSTMDLAENLAEFLGYAGREALLETMNEACCMDNPNANLVQLRDAMGEVSKR